MTDEEARRKDRRESRGTRGSQRMAKDKDGDKKERDRSSRSSRRQSSAVVEEKPSSAASKGRGEKDKDKEAAKAELDPDLVEVRPGGGYSKKCVIPTVILAVLLAGAAGAGIFFAVYYFLFMISYCPWTQMATGCYQFFQDSKNWTQAQQLCRARGGRLAELEGFDKQMDVVNLYDMGGHQPACFWIGGFESDAANNMFTWNISQRLMEQYFTEWESGYPKNRSVSTCVDFCHPDFSWKNKQCSLKQNYLCAFG